MLPIPNYSTCPFATLRCNTKQGTLLMRKIYPLLVLLALTLAVCSASLPTEPTVIVEMTSSTLRRPPPDRSGTSRAV